MRAVVGGLVIGVGFAWVVAWLLARWFSQRGIFSQGFGTAFRSRTRAENDQLDRRGREDYRRALVFFQRGVPVAVLVIVAGIVVAVV